YADWPEALAKLRYCDELMAVLKDREPLVTEVDRDEDATALPQTLEQLYQATEAKVAAIPGLDGALRTIFEDLEGVETGHSAATLRRRMTPALMNSVSQWTGHFPERTRNLVHHLADRAEQLRQVYPLDQESDVTVRLTALVTALAVNHVQRGSYLP